MLRTFAAPILVLGSLLFSQALAAQTKPQPFLYSDVSCGKYRFPEILFNFADLEKHPGSLSGAGCSFGLSHPISKTVSVGIHFSREHGRAFGSYLTQDAINQAAGNGAVLTQVTGLSTFTTKSFVMDVKKAFPLHHGRYAPFISGGVGRGVLIADFGGVAAFTVPDYGPSTQAAQDHSVHHIWTPTLETGIEFRVSPYLTTVVAAHWNTGYGINAGIKFPVPVRRIGSAFKSMF